MAESFEMAKKKFVSHNAKAKGNCNFAKDVFSLKSMEKACLFNVWHGEKIVKINEKLLRSVLVISFRPNVSLYLVSATNFHFKVF